MTHSKTDGQNLKPAVNLRDDKHAFNLVMALATDLKGDLPDGFADLVIGRARNRDHEFFVESLPTLASAVASHASVSGKIYYEFSLVDRPLAALTKQQRHAIYILGSFLKKYPFRDSRVYTDEYREQAALRKFRQANRWCSRINRIGRGQGQHPLIAEARRIIRSILPKFKWEEAVKRSYFGPGVNVGVSWEETDTQCKLYLDKTLTRPLMQQMDFAADLVPAYLFYEGVRSARQFDYDVSAHPGTWEVPLSNRYSFLVALGLAQMKSSAHVVAGSKYATAPKDAKTLRSIAAEPMLNSFLQNGIGVWMRELLAAFSAQLDCSDQERNRALAYAGSATGWLATIDLSSASDTIAAQLIKLLMPDDWYRAMRLVRSSYIKIDGVDEKLHMFSSMGNGYTFPLETLVFYAISVAAIRLADKTADLEPNQGGPGANREPSVYGDDIIVTSEDAPVVLKALRDCGFWPNEKKSFYRGPFRESCGHDYYEGEYIRPIFLRRPLEWSFDAISLINHLSNPAGFGWYTTRYGTLFSSFCKSLVDLTRSYPPIPAGPIGDTHVVTYVRLPLVTCRKIGAVHKDQVSADTRGRKTYTEQFYPLRVTPRKFADVEDVAKYLKGMLQTPKDLESKSSLYTRVKRGEVTVRLPRRDSGTPILGWDDNPVYRLLLARYLPLLRGIRWYNPRKHTPRRS